ncbi:SagB-type dehydrogenase family enzyme [Streptomyces sp. B3I7]|jgi:SagB-type dehydrogenase family enzyme|uniref:SagB/ThcOx family dehydrogenase n=1 Tax=unclassified Streptomyces TaxID=2593676 RepID=UPI00278195DF|nr:MULTISPECIES: SagB/ThcOx family dehydrogenase [unclassified Streptomyces]MDQ0789743.1 SagB-type dehydrogenase family enzyme [Streptomyces sp. B3I8]MDQ0810647.1 SagB-type dehydrogenase family enzyme [Streptomyces sp. B3I7]
MKVRRPEHLVLRWRPEGLEVGVPGRAQWIRLSDDLRKVLDRAGDGIDLDDLAAAFGSRHEAGVRRAVTGLLRLGVLAPVDGDQRVPDLWQRWGGLTRRFHTETRDVDYLVDSPRRTDEAQAILAGGDAPPAYKEYPDSPVVLLPRRPLPLTTPVDEVFAARRTHRRFADAPVSLDRLGTLLFHSFAPHRFIDGGDFGTQQCRVSASAGGRHEVEAYVVAHNVTGVPPGLYHYSVVRHALELLDARADRARLADLTYHQDASYQGAFTILTTAVANRLAWKYRHPRAYRLWMYDAGHYGQTFSLTATALGLGPFQTVAFADSRVEQFLGVDPDDEFAVYLLAAGVPEEPDSLLPADFAFPSPGVVR